MLIFIDCLYSGQFCTISAYRNCSISSNNSRIASYPLSFTDLEAETVRIWNLLEVTQHSWVVENLSWQHCVTSGAWPGRAQQCEWTGPKRRGRHVWRLGNWVSTLIGKNDSRREIWQREWIAHCPTEASPYVGRGFSMSSAVRTPRGSIRKCAHLVSFQQMASICYSYRMWTSAHILTESRAWLHGPCQPGRDTQWRCPGFLFESMSLVRNWCHLNRHSDDACPRMAMKSVKAEKVSADAAGWVMGGVHSQN